MIDLSYNDVRGVERHAFAWLRRLDVVLGHGRVPLSLDAYSFYGARDMRRLAVAGVPALTLLPRIFTNTHVRCHHYQWCIGGGYTRVYAVYQLPGFFDSVYSPEIRCVLPFTGSAIW